MKIHKRKNILPVNQKFGKQQLLGYENRFRPEKGLANLRFCSENSEVKRKITERINRRAEKHKKDFETKQKTNPTH